MNAKHAICGAVLLLIATFASASSVSSEDVGATLVDLLRRDDVRALGNLTRGLEPLPASELEDLRMTIDEYDCISVPTFTTTVESQSDDRLVLRVSMSAWGSTLAAWHPVRELPRWWHVEARRAGDGWRIVQAMTGERWTARRMLKAPSFRDAECILSSTDDIDALAAIRHYSYDNEGQIAQADHAVQLAEESGDVYTQVVTLRLQAIYRNTKGAERSFILEPALRAERLARDQGTATDLAEALFGIGVAYVLMHDYRSASPSFLAAAELVEQTEEPLRALKSLHMATWTNQDPDQVSRNLSMGERLERLSRRYGWHEGEMAALFERADFYAGRYRTEASCRLFEQALRGSEAMANPNFIAHAFGGLANCAAQKGDWNAQLGYFRRAVQFDSPEQGWFYVGMARLLIRMKRYTEAAEILDHLPEILQVEARADLLLARSELALHLGRPGDAVSLARQNASLLAEAPQSGSDETVVHALIQLGEALRANGQKTEAMRVLTEAVGLVEAGRDRLTGDAVSSARFFDDFIADGYAELVDLLVGFGDSAAAFRVAEAMKGRTLRNAIDTGHIDPVTPMNETERERSGNLEQQVVDLNRAMSRALLRGESTDDLKRKLEIARGELDAFRSEMIGLHPELRWRTSHPRRDEPLPAAWSSLATIEYVLTRHSAIAFVITRGKDGGAIVRAKRLPIARDDLLRDANRLSDLVANRSAGWSAPARRLYAALIAPFERWLAGKTEICIIPEGALWRVPFQTLLSADGTRIIDRRALFYAHSLALLRTNAGTEHHGPARLLAFGNPTVGGTAKATLASTMRDIPLGPLIDAEREVRSLASLYPPGSAKVYVRESAREAVLKSVVGSFDVLHIAAHAVVDDRAPMYSAIVLATADDELSEDGLLEAREIVELPMHADLAVLSACDTARGTIAKGEGVLGLAWAFFAAGCPTTVVSQWQAESRVTSVLMIEFHRQLVAGRSPAEALRSAQRAISKQPRYAHPFYWAPFVAIGSAERTLHP